MNVILWDFDGTLGYREGGWTGAVLESLQRHPHLSSLQRDDIRPHLQTGYPWHDPASPHAHITSADAWWADLYPVFERAFLNLGGVPTEMPGFAREVRDTFLKARSWRIYDDVETALARLSEQGWTHYVLSNHVPELREIVRRLGLESHFAGIYTSGETGFEKPHPEAYRVALEGREANRIWMVGDSFVADYEGARNVGIPSILVRKPDDRADLYAERLDEATTIIETSESDSPLGSSV